MGAGGEVGKQTIGIRDLLKQSVLHKRKKMVSCCHCIVVKIEPVVKRPGKVRSIELQYTRKSFAEVRETNY